MPPSGRSANTNVRSNNTGDAGVTSLNRPNCELAIASNKTQLAMATTAPRHLAMGGTMMDATETAEGETWAVKESGNSVTLEAELLKSGEIDRGFSLNTSIQKSFYGLLMMSVKA